MTESLVSAMYKIGWSFGFVLEYVGGDGKSVGRLPVACEIAVCTSVAAASMLLSRANCSVKAHVALRALRGHQFRAH